MQSGGQQTALGKKFITSCDASAAAFDLPSARRTNAK